MGEACQHRESPPIPRHIPPPDSFYQRIKMLGKLVGLAMLLAASFVFLYYSIWTLLMPFVDDDHVLQNFFPPRVWAIRIPVIIILLGGAVVGFPRHGHDPEQQKEGRQGQGCCQEDELDDQNVDRYTL